MNQGQCNIMMEAREVAITQTMCRSHCLGAYKYVFTIIIYCFISFYISSLSSQPRTTQRHDGGHGRWRSPNDVPFTSFGMFFLLSIVFFFLLTHIYLVYHHHKPRTTQRRNVRPGRWRSPKRRVAHVVWAHMKHSHGVS
jgi:hypothetical protein